MAVWLNSGNFWCEVRGAKPIQYLISGLDCILSYFTFFSKFETTVESGNRSTPSSQACSAPVAELLLLPVLLLPNSTVTFYSHVGFVMDSCLKIWQKSSSWLEKMTTLWDTCNDNFICCMCFYFFAFSQLFVNNLQVNDGYKFFYVWGWCFWKIRLWFVRTIQYLMLFWSRSD